MESDKIKNKQVGLLNVIGRTGGLLNMCEDTGRLCRGGYERSGGIKWRGGKIGELLNVI